MLASSTFVAMSTWTTFSGELPPMNVQRPRVAAVEASQLPIPRGEFEMLEPTCRSEGELWSQLGSWDM